jgi:DNA-binding NarL/FixJ family response regulator
MVIRTRDADGLHIPAYGKAFSPCHIVIGAPMPIKVLLADDHEVIRMTLKRILSADPEIELVGMAVNFVQAMQFCTELRPDIVLMDLHMRDENEVTPEQVKSCLGRSRVLAMSIWSDEQARSLADRLGALVLLDKATLGTELIPAIKLCAKL